MALTRRSFLQITGAAGAGPVLASFGDVFRPAQPAPLAERTLITACGLCDSACGIRATVRDGVLRFLEGLPEDLQGRGHLCGKGAAGAALLYDPDRLKYPMKRTNPAKGLDEDPGWVRITWTEALDTIAARFQEVLDKHGPEALLFISRPSPDIWVRFLRAIGVVNRVDHIDVCYTADRVVQRYMIGGRTWCTDFDNSRYIVLFGWDLVARNKLVFTHGIVAAKEKGAKVVCFNPQYSITARFADEWHPIRPGSDLAVVLAMIHVILAENLFDRDFVTNYTNFPQYEAQIRQHFAQYTPEWAERESDIPAATIRRIAREFATIRPSVAPSYKKTLTANYANSGQFSQAVCILNILVGNIDRPGGPFFARTISIPGVDAIVPPPRYPTPRGRRVDGRDKLPFVQEDDSGLFSTLADGMLNRYPGMIRAAFINSYSLLSFPNPRRMEEALKTVPFVVVMDTLPADGTALADIVLPSTMYLESSDLVSRDRYAPRPQVVARQPVVSPMFEARSISFVAIELGKRLAPDYFKNPDGSWISTSAVLDERTRRAGLGASFAEFAARGIETRDQPFVPRTTFATPGGTGKCQIYVPQFAERGAEPLPTWKPRRDVPSAEYPYYYLTYIPAVHRRNSTENNAILHEMMPTNTAMINPALAAKLGVREGDLVRIRSRVGSIELPAHLTETLRPDCVLVAHGFGHRSRFLRLASGKGVRDGDVIPDWSVDEMLQAGDWFGSGAIMDAVVRIERVAV
ncbi:MAG: molybdopterin-dependent oxidoreductase [Bryobacterales bacterium]|nr:molybdopterin-dependent oxidoreductase [Bryobacteraceae bacterium]MDW8355663.1 molybdopterin-dependent oxidoreductase [Bryobacterales bacterium]